MPLGPLKLLPCCWSSKGVWLGPCVGSLRRTTWDSKSFFHQFNFCWFLQLELIFLAVEPWAGGPWCGAGTPCSWDMLPKFLSTIHGCGTSLFHVSVPPTSLDGCGFFNSIVVRLPFNSISDHSEWWLFYILVVILMWWLDEVSSVYLCCHLNLSSIFSSLNEKSREFFQIRILTFLFWKGLWCVSFLQSKIS